MTPRDNSMPFTVTRSAIGAAAVYLIALTVTGYLHELAHALGFALTGHAAVLFYDHVQPVDMTLPDRVGVIPAAAGPAFSFVQGLICAYLAQFCRTRLTRMFALWFAWSGIMVGAGYLLTTPFMNTADMGLVAKNLEWPMALRVAVAIVGFVIFRNAADRFVPAFLALAPDAWIHTPQQRRTWITQTVVLAWALSLPLEIISSWPAAAPIALIFPIVLGLPLLDMPAGAEKLETVTSIAPYPDEPPLAALLITMTVILTALRLLTQNGVIIGSG